MKITSLLLFLSLLLLGGCQTQSPVSDLLQGRKIDYTADDSQKSQSLQVPPDLLSTARGTEATVSLSEYSIQAIPVIDAAADVVVDVPAARVAYRRNGNLRWITVDLPPSDVWGVVRNFWSRYLGFELTKENAELGVMETDWLDLRERIASPGWLNEYIGIFMERLQDSGERDKFVTRLERNEQGGTDVYVTHRHVAAQFDGQGIFSGYESQSSEQQLEVEMLRRLMLYVAGRDVEGDSDSDSEVIEEEVAAEIAVAEAVESSDYVLQGSELLINKPFAESWQLVQVGLNRGGFSIEDRDYQEGIIYIRHSGGPDSDKIFGKAETNFFNRLFGEQKPILREIELVFTHENSEQVVLTARAIEEDEPLTDIQASVVLELLHEYLP